MSAADCTGHVKSGLTLLSVASTADRPTKATVEASLDTSTVYSGLAGEPVGKAKAREGNLTSLMGCL